MIPVPDKLLILLPTVSVLVLSPRVSRLLILLTLAFVNRLTNGWKIRYLANTSSIATRKVPTKAMALKVIYKDGTNNFNQLPYCYRFNRNRVYY